MPRYKPYDYDQMMMVPVSLEEQLVPGTLEYAIHQLIDERIDTAIFDEKYRNDDTGRRAYDPKVLLKIVLFAYSRGMLHSRRIERACKENVTFMALACGQKPDHSTIAAFISSMGEEQVVSLFTQVLMVCEEDGLLGGTYFSLDGLKLSSNASVVHAQAFGETGDSTSMESLLEGTKSNLEAVGREDPLTGKTVSADTGYFSTTNLQSCQDAQVDAYIPDPKFRERDVRFAEAKRHRRPTDKRKLKYKKKPKRWFTNDDFVYDNSIGKLICPAGKELYIKNRNFFTPDGFLGVAYQAPKKACSGCKLRSKCLRNPDSKIGRQVHYLHGRRPGSLTDEMREKIDTPEGRTIYGKRLAIVEPVFGNIRECKGMDRFTLRGRVKVNIQWTLYCLVHNIGKIANFGTSYAMAS